MSHFLSVLRNERAQLDPAASSEELPAAREALESARAELRDWRDKNLARIEKRGYWQPEAQAETRLESNVEVARARLEKIEQDQKGIEQRIREIDSYLNADANLRQAQAAYAGDGAKRRELSARAEQLDEIIRSLNGEIAELTEKQQETLDRYGAAEIEARLAGKTAPTPKSLSSNEADLSSRRAALASAERTRGETQASIDALLESSQQARTQLRSALLRKAELSYFEALPAFLPTIARVMALNSWVGGSPTRHVFEIRVDDELIGAATAQIEADMRGEAV